MSVIQEIRERFEKQAAAEFEPDLFKPKGIDVDAYGLERHRDNLRMQSELLDGKGVDKRLLIPASIAALATAGYGLKKHRDVRKSELEGGAKQDEALDSRR